MSMPQIPADWMPDPYKRDSRGRVQYDRKGEPKTLTANQFANEVVGELDKLFQPAMDPLSVEAEKLPALVDTLMLLTGKTFLGKPEKDENGAWDEPYKTILDSLGLTRIEISKNKDPVHEVLRKCILADFEAADGEPLHECATRPVARVIDTFRGAVKRHGAANAQDFFVNGAPKAIGNTGPFIAKTVNSQFGSINDSLKDGYKVTSMAAEWEHDFTSFVEVNGGAAALPCRRVVRRVRILDSAGHDKVMTLFEACRTFEAARRALAAWSIDPDEIPVLPATTDITSVNPAIKRVFMPCSMDHEPDEDFNDYIVYSPLNCTAYHAAVSSRIRSENYPTANNAIGGSNTQNVSAYLKGEIHSVSARLPRLHSSELGRIIRRLAAHETLIVEHDRDLWARASESIPAIDTSRFDGRRQMEAWARRLVSDSLQSLGFARRQFGRASREVLDSVLADKRLKALEQIQDHIEFRWLSTASSDAVWPLGNEDYRRLEARVMDRVFDALRRQGTRHHPDLEDYLQKAAYNALRVKRSI